MAESHYREKVQLIGGNDSSLNELRWFAKAHLIRRRWSLNASHFLSFKAWKAKQKGLDSCRRLKSCSGQFRRVAGFK